MHEITDENLIADALWARAVSAMGKLNGGDDAQDKLRNLAQTEPQVVKKLIGHYDRETDPKAKELLRSMLSTIESPAVLAFSKRLATSTDAAQRMEGLAMLQNLSIPTQEDRSIIRQSLDKEQTSGVIMQALRALKAPAPLADNAARPGTAPDAAESAAIIAQLQGLTRNPDTAVRSQSILSLAQWDKSGAQLANLTLALTDQAPEVRQSAIFAIAQSGAQSDNAKSALLAVINNANENKNIRASALQVLETFALNKEELASASQLRSRLVGW